MPWYLIIAHLGVSNICIIDTRRDVMSHVKLCMYLYLEYLFNFINYIVHVVSLSRRVYLRVFVYLF